MNDKVNCGTRDTPQVIHVDRMRPVRSQLHTGEDENKRVSETNSEDSDKIGTNSLDHENPKPWIFINFILISLYVMIYLALYSNIHYNLIVVQYLLILGCIETNPDPANHSRLSSLKIVHNNVCSLLPKVVCKILEKILFKHMYNYCLKNNIINKYQSGFQPGDSITN